MGFTMRYTSWCFPHGCQFVSSVKTMRVHDKLTKRKVGGEVNLKTYNIKLHEELFFKTKQQNIIGCWRAHFHMKHLTYLHILLKYLPMGVCQVAFPNVIAIYESRKHQNLECMGFEFPTCDSNYYSFLKVVIKDT